MKLWLWTSVLLLTLALSCTGEAIEIRAISACIDSLKENGSSNIIDGQISNEFSAARVRIFSATDLILLSFGKADTDQSDSIRLDTIEHRSGVYCLVDGHGNVVGLVSPEIEDGRAELIEFVSGFDPIEEKAIQEIDKVIRAGKTVIVRQSRFLITEHGIEKLGESEETKLVDEAWSVQF